MSAVRRKLYEMLSEPADGDRVSRGVDIFLMALISLNVFAVVIETVQGLPTQLRSVLRVIEVGSVAIFTVEYLSRVLVCTLDRRFRHPLWGRLLFALTPLALVDLLAILPFYLPMLIHLDLRFLRAVRLVRLFRLVKMGRYSRSLKLLGRVVSNAKAEIFITLFVGAIILVLSSSAVYLAEREAQPDRFPNIPASMWWGVVTLTTVGYGDMAPVTTMGRIIGSMIAILGVGMFALPAGILASGFVEEMSKLREKRMVCPHCGKNFYETS